MRSLRTNPEMGIFALQGGEDVKNLTLSSRAVVRFYNRRSSRPCLLF
jgi:hypothetical protein